MSRIYVSSVIKAPIGKVWAAVRDFNALPNWHPDIAESRIEEGLVSDRVGCVRQLTLKSGGIIRERLLTLSDLDHLCSYTIIDSPLPVRDYVGTLRLRSITDGDHTFAEWSAEFESDQVENMVNVIGGGIFQKGFTALKVRFGSRDNGAA